MKKILSGLRKPLEAYSPLAMAILIIPFFLPVDHQTHRRLLLLFCAFPGMLLTLLNPKAVFKNPILLLMMLFVAYFTLQDVRGSLPVTPKLIRDVLTLAAIIVFPAVTLSFSTPKQRMYPLAMRLVLMIAVICSSYSLFGFYSENPFPATRLELAFRGSGNPIPDSWKSGFAALLAGAFFLQNGLKSKRTDWFTLACVPVLLATTLYSHTRSTALALLAAMAASLPGMKKRIKKTLLLFSMAAATLLLYFASLYSTQAASSPVSQQPQLELKTEAAPPRSAGLAVSGAAGAASIIDRLNIWQDHFSRMNSAKMWLIGHGLGRSNFVKEVTPNVQLSYYISPNGFQLHAQSGYVWALYYGGLIGLGILLTLLGTAGWKVFQAGYAGYIPGALLVFSTTILIVDTQKLLVGVGSSEYLLFWVPLGLAAGLSGKQTA